MKAGQPGTRRVLFANFPADGHFNPLTGIAVHLKTLGYDVRWYTSSGYAAKLRKMQIRHYPFKKAVDVSGNDFDSVFPGRTEKKSQIAKLKFDIIHAFILRSPEYYEDILEIYNEFPFDLLIGDAAFTGIPFVKDKMNIPVISVGVFPISETSKDLPPSGLGMTPSYTWAGQIKQSLLRAITNRFIFGQPNKVMHDLFDKHGIPHNHESVFDVLSRKSDLILQSGTPGFEYKRSDLSKKLRFVGALLPAEGSRQAAQQWFDDRLRQYGKIILVTQGTVEKDVNKILVPTLEAYKDTDTLVIATTGGTDTARLRERYPQPNLIIRDFIPFADVMPFADVYITNGGYGGVMLGIEHHLPLVVAGVHEGKNEICARVGYFKLGINLKTETPNPAQIKKAVQEVMEQPHYRENVVKLAKEFAEYDTYRLCAEYVAQMIGQPSPANNNRTAIHVY
ncbi:MAG: glycosyltransferase [Bacteroidetes bacterium]|nr:glycosyltransferase [Bacteroidota bacterium]